VQQKIRREVLNVRLIASSLVIFSLLLPAALSAQNLTQAERELAAEAQAAKDRREDAAKNEADMNKAKQQLGNILAETAAGMREAAERKRRYAGIEPTNFGHRWTVDHWQVWAEPDKMCEAMEKLPFRANASFWGFRQGPGPNLELFFSSDGPARPTPVRMSFNDGGRFVRTATVERRAQTDFYLIPLGKSTTAIFPNRIDFEAFIDETSVWSVTSLDMSKLETTMLKCWEWQLDH
jgi:hypothetical protein